MQKILQRSTASSARRTAEIAVAAATILFVPGLIVAILHSWHDQLHVAHTLWSSPAGRIGLIIAQVLGFLGVAAFIWRAYLALRYRPTPLNSHARLPEITVVVPAYNEGRQVLDTLASLIHSDYPPQKLRIIAVDDGSKDDTWKWLCRAEALHPGRIATVHCAVNRGKRHALNEGFKRSSGDIIVTIDSDSEVEPDTLRQLVAPFVADARIGAVGGGLRVMNKHEGFIPKMLDVVLTLAGDWQRAYQSEVNSLHCCPGALAAYRRDVLMSVLDEWMGQTFFGRRATIGEDRAMTALIMRSGCHTKYQRSAVVHTNVPTTYRGLCKMYIRWHRSGVRETTRLGRFVFRRFRESGRTGVRINFLLDAANLALAQWLGIVARTLIVLSPLAVGLQLLAAALLASILPGAVYVIVRRSSHAIWALPYAVFSAFALFWIAPYAALTCYKSGWLTRQVVDPPSHHAAPALLRRGTVA